MEKIFNKEEFQRLLFLTFLGEWVMNAHRGVDSKVEYIEVHKGTTSKNTGFE